MFMHSVVHRKRLSEGRSEPKRMRRAQRGTGNRTISQRRPKVPDTEVRPTGHTGNDNPTRHETSGFDDDV